MILQQVLAQRAYTDGLGLVHGGDGCDDGVLQDPTGQQHFVSGFLQLQQQTVRSELIVILKNLTKMVLARNNKYTKIKKMLSYDRVGTELAQFYTPDL